MTDDSPRKPWRETIPGYLAGVAAVATAIVSVLTFLYHRSGDQESDAKDGSATELAAERPTIAAEPSMVDASKPNRCAPYVGAWRLSSGELLTFSGDERFEIAVSDDGTPKFGRWSCTGRDGETLYVTPDRERTIVFTRAPDGTRLYQRTTKQGVTPLEAVRE